MKNLSSALILIFIIATFTFADAPNGLAFLKISPDVRSSAMGETGVVAGDQRAASFYNPALLALADKRGISFAHHRWIVDTQVNFLEIHFTSLLNVGFNILSTGVDDIEVRPTPSPQPTSYIDSRDLSLGMNLSYSVNPNFHLGLNAKFIHEHILYENTDGFALDFGVLYKFNERTVMGASVSNLGGMNEMLNEKPDLPLTGRIGLSYLFPLKSAGSALLAGGVNYIRDEEVRGNFGLEWQPVELIALRGGYMFNYDERGITAGFGLQWKQFGFDFAFVPFDSDLGEVKRFGFYLEF